MSGFECRNCLRSLLTVSSIQLTEDINMRALLDVQHGSLGNQHSRIIKHQFILLSIGVKYGESIAFSPIDAAPKDVPVRSLAYDQTWV